MLFMTELDICKSKKWHHMYIFFTIMQVSKLVLILIEEIFTWDDVIRLIKAALNNDKSQYYYKIFRKMLVSIS